MFIRANFNDVVEYGVPDGIRKAFGVYAGLVWFAEVVRSALLAFQRLNVP
jgi:hypothetical protein